jgi:hypothetical protein
LDIWIPRYEESYWKKLEHWTMNDRQNLVVLCEKCHTRLHNGVAQLRHKYDTSFTEPVSWYNVPFKKDLSLY